MSVEPKTLPSGLISYENEVTDSSALMNYKFCPRYYFHTDVLGYKPLIEQPYFTFGTAYHLFREHLEIEFLLRKKSLSDDDLQGCYFTAASIALDYWKKNGIEAPDGTKYDFLNTNRLMKSIAYTYTIWKKEKLANQIEVLFTEQVFSLEMDSGIRTGGRFDQVILWNGEPWGRDFKTTSVLDAKGELGDYYERSLDPNDQFSRYTWAESKLSGRQIKGQYVEVLCNNRKFGPTIKALPTSRTEYQLKEWEHEQSYWDMVIKYSRANNLYPANEKSCRNCHFHSTCKLPDLQSRLKNLETYFVVRPWDYTKTNGDE